MNVSGKSVAPGDTVTYNDQPITQELWDEIPVGTEIRSSNSPHLGWTKVNATEFTRKTERSGRGNPYTPQSFAGHYSWSYTVPNKKEDNVKVAGKYTDSQLTQARFVEAPVGTVFTSRSGNTAFKKANRTQVAYTSGRGQPWDFNPRHFGLPYNWSWSESTNPELDAFKVKLAEVARKAAKKHGWCDEVEKILTEDLGLPALEKWEHGDVVTAGKHITATYHRGGNEHGVHWLISRHDNDWTRVGTWVNLGWLKDQGEVKLVYRASGL